MSREYMRLAPDTNWVILEPNPFPAENVTARYIEAFADDNFMPDVKYDLVVHSHVWEHLYEPRRLIKNISRFMSDGSLQIFSVPNMSVWEERHYPSCLNFEHTYMLKEPYCEYILNEFGYSLVKKQYFKDGHSIFYVFRKDGTSFKGDRLQGSCSKDEADKFLDYCHYFSNKVIELNHIISRCERPIYLFGGHILSQYLLALGLKTPAMTKIVSILDNAPSKQGKRLYGCDLYVNSPEILRDVKEPVVILIDNPYSQEIKHGILNDINDSVTFLE